MNTLFTAGALLTGCSGFSLRSLRAGHTRCSGQVPNVAIGGRAFQVQFCVILILNVSGVDENELADFNSIRCISGIHGGNRFVGLRNRERIPGITFITLVTFNALDTLITFWSLWTGFSLRSLCAGITLFTFQGTAIEFLLQCLLVRKIDQLRYGLDISLPNYFFCFRVHDLHSYF